MSRTKTYELTTQIYNLRLHHNGHVQCRFCDEELNIGETVVSKRIRRGKKSVVYHLDCAKRLYIV